MNSVLPFTKLALVEKEKKKLDVGPFSFVSEIYSKSTTRSCQQPQYYFVIILLRLYLMFLQLNWMFYVRLYGY